MQLCQQLYMINCCVIVLPLLNIVVMQNVYAPEEDPEMTVEHYERSFEQNEFLGLNDMKTVNYTTKDA